MPMQPSRRHVLSLTAAALLGAGTRQVIAQPAIATTRLVAGFPPGGTGDAVARRYAERLQGSYAAAAVVENRTGAGGQIAVTAMKTLPNDAAQSL
jgi:tripartite-type tricarboxylate transporter receptor subunit TctC